MELTGAALQSALSGRAVQATGMQYAILMAGRAIELMQTEGQNLVQLIEQAAGLGQNIDTSA